MCSEKDICLIVLTHRLTNVALSARELHTRNDEARVEWDGFLKEVTPSEK